jgi:hypothetical protein
LNTAFSTSRLISVVAVLSLFSAEVGYSANTSLWSIDITGGEGPDTLLSFYQSAQQRFTAMKNFGVPEKQRFELFGRKGSACYSSPTAAANEALTQERAAFLAQPNDCSKAAPIFVEFTAPSTPTLMCSDSKHNVLDLDGDGKTDVTSIADTKNFLNDINKVISQAKKGDHLALNLNDHGQKLPPDYWGVGFGDMGDGISVDQLKPLLAKLQAKGVIVHLDVQACYSGGFVALSDSDNQNAPICTTTSADANVMGYGADALFPTTFDGTYQKNIQQYGNQLQAFACSVAEDSVNRPITTLDQIVNAWEKSQPPTSLSNCEPVSNLAGVQQQVSGFIDTIGKDDASNAARAALISAYNDTFVKAFASCATDHNSDVKLVQGLKSCLSDPQAKLDSSLQNLFGTFLNQGTPNDFYLSTINRQLRFLKLASNDQLAKFKNAFCCLSYNMNTGDSPAVCK